MQLIALDVGDDFVVEADLVQVAAAVIQIVDLSAVGQDGGGELMVEAAFGNQAVEDVIGKAVARTVFIGEAD